MNRAPPPISAPEPTVVVSAGMLADDLEPNLRLRRLAGQSGLARPIRHPRVQKSGLALAGHFYGVVPARVQILGETELSYLDSLDAEGRTVSARGFFSLALSCVIVTSNQEPPRTFLAAAEATGTPLFLSNARSSRTINAVHAILDDRLAPQTTLHGVLVDVFGVGLLLLGKSGIGKSECALELVLRGHRLVADDVVQCDWRPPGVVFGAPANLLRHHIEARGLGVLNVKALFGVTSVRDRKSIDVVVRLVEWDKSEEYDRLGVEDKYHTILGTPIRELTVPVRPGRDMGSILEVAARNELLRRAGEHSAREFLGRLEGHLLDGSNQAGSSPSFSHSGDATPGHASPDQGASHLSHLSPMAGRDAPGPGEMAAVRQAAAHLGVPSPSPRTPPNPASSGTGAAHQSDDEAEDSKGPASSFPSERPNESSAWIPAVRPGKG